MFNSSEISAYFNGKSILVTGHTGFKGSWLLMLLKRMNVRVIGMSLPPLQNSLYELAGLKGGVEEYFIDINDYFEVNKVISEVKPDFIIHLAAQALVLESYNNPVNTFKTNVVGTMNVLESARKLNSVEAVGVITTDKVYKNLGTGERYKESDSLGGSDPYSSSKVGTESVITAWRSLLNSEGCQTKLIALRAGNVVGGGDLAKNRLLPDIVRAYKQNQTLEIRNPKATRPWQHVLDPLAGYLMALRRSGQLDFPTELNFGPNEPSLPVSEVVEIATSMWQDLKVKYDYKNDSSRVESLLLDLDSTKSYEILKWTPHWSQRESIIETLGWWEKINNMSISPNEACRLTIENYISA